MKPLDVHRSRGAARFALITSLAILGLLVVSPLVVTFARAQQQSLSVVANIPGVPMGIPAYTSGGEGLAYDSGKGEIFVAEYNANQVAVISDSSNKVVANITGFNEPEGLAYDSAKGEVFVSNSGSNSVSVISDTSNKVVIANISVGSYPVALAYDSVNGEVFVSNYGSHSVSVISDSTNEVVQNITVGRTPAGIVFDSGKGEIFVADSNACQGLCPPRSNVTVISGSNNTFVTNVTVPAEPYVLAYDSAKGEVFASTEEGTFNESVYVISDSSNSLVASVPINGDLRWSYLRLSEWGGGCLGRLQPAHGNIRQQQHGRAKRNARRRNGRGRLRLGQERGLHGGDQLFR